jgi:hypothetical protein
MEALVGNTIARILADKGYRGHNTPPDYKFGYFSRANAWGTPQIKRELRRRSAVEPSSAISRPSTAWAAIISGSGSPRGCLIASNLSNLLAEPVINPSLKSGFFTDCVPGAY